MNPMLQLVMIAAMAFGLLLTVARSGAIGWWLVAGLVVVTALAAGMVYLLRFEKNLAARLHVLPGCRQFIDLVCKVSKEPPPPPPSASGGPSGSGSAKGSRGEAGAKQDENLLLKGPNDFSRAERDLKYRVRGHDVAIERMLGHLRQSLILRQGRQRQHADGPLGVFLVVGEEGIGKRYLGLVMARALYKSGAAQVFDAQSYSDGAGAMADLFGTGSQCGRLVAALRAAPQQTIVIEHVEMLGPKVLDALRDLFHAGVVSDEAGRPVGVQDSLFVLCTTKCVAAARTVEARGVEGDERRKQLREALSADTPLDSPFLSQLTDVVCLERLAGLAKAEVVGLLMQAECQKYKVVLDYVDPEILVAEVSAVSDAYGLKEAPARVVRLLKPAIAEALGAGRKRIVLARDDVAMPIEASAEGTAEVHR